MTFAYQTPPSQWTSADVRQVHLMAARVVPTTSAIKCWADVSWSRMSGEMRFFLGVADGNELFCQVSIPGVTAADMLRCFPVLRGVEGQYEYGELLPAGHQPSTSVDHFHPDTGHHDSPCPYQDAGLDIHAAWDAMEADTRRAKTNARRRPLRVGVARGLRVVGQASADGVR